MHIEVKPLDADCNVVRIIGRLDATGVERVEARFTAAAVEPGKNALLDFTRVEFIASMGIRMLITAARGVSNKGKRLAIFGANQVVGYVLESVALGELIPIEADQQAAREAIAN